MEMYYMIVNNPCPRCGKKINPDSKRFIAIDSVVTGVSFSLGNGFFEEKVVIESTMRLCNKCMDSKDVVSKEIANDIHYSEWFIFKKTKALKVSLFMNKDKKKTIEFVKLAKKLRAMEGFKNFKIDS